jgi:uncharacterized protein with FMN-binding domain
MSTRDERPPFTRRALPVVALAAGVIAVWRSMDSSSANTVRVAIRPRTTPTTAAPARSATTAGAQPPANPTTTTLVSTVCAHPVAITGPTAETQWGPVQVRAQLGTGNHVCSAHAIVTPSDHDQSVWINQQAVPMIDGEIAAQGVNFDTIGGATITSDGYRASLQAIVDRQPK